MPAVLALPAFWGAVSAGTAGAGAIYAANKQSSATNRAMTLQDRAAQDAQRIEQDAEARRRQEFDLVQTRAKEQWDAEQAEIVRQAAEEQRRYEIGQADLAGDRAERNRLNQIAIDTDKERYAAEQVRREPYRAAGRAALGVLSGRSSEPAPSAPPMQAPAYSGPRPSPAPDTMAGMVGNAPAMTQMPQTRQTGRMLTQGEVADMDPAKLEELVRSGFQLPPMGALVGQGRPGVSRGY